MIPNFFRPSGEKKHPKNVRGFAAILNPREYIILIYIVLIVQKSNVCTIQRAAGGNFCGFAKIASSFVISALILMKNWVLKNVRIFHVGTFFPKMYLFEFSGFSNRSISPKNVPK